MTSPEEPRDRSLESRLKALLEQAAMERDPDKLLVLTSEISQLVDREVKKKEGDSAA